MSIFSSAKNVNDGAAGHNGLSVRHKGSLFVNYPELYKSGVYDSSKPPYADQLSGKKALLDAPDHVKTAVERIDEAINDNVAPVLEPILDPDPAPTGHTSSRGSTAKPIIYSDWSPAAQQFGMDQATAYAEHMSNTAHQREVADLRAAGLNPVLGLGSGASGVAGSVASISGAGGSGSSSAEKVGTNQLLDILGATATVITAFASKDPSKAYMVGNLFKAFKK